MKVVIDTSSLLSLVRYYLPFDKENILFDFFKSKIESKEFIILDKVHEECKYTSKGLVVKSLDYLSNKKYRVKTEELLPSNKFFNQVDNQFINRGIINKLDPVEFENRRNAFLNSADVKLILFGLKYNNGLDNYSIVTEETEFSNDNKSFKKLPAICKILDLNVLTLPELLELSEGVDFEIKK
ncbi:DUF4411 family protein [uncultured Draconibacterium sp.]|uniref:DUF4411 family protein n=1 Tax=uncultured Draconibacterium sp. TaxID=1573823 RepID=UPI0029C78CDE|nr:DUF4411 family protein [uncultured Draconibacterium sp.]